MNLLYRFLPVFFLIFFMGTPHQAIGQLRSYQAITPEKALDFSFQDADGKTLKLRDFRGKIVLLNFWAPWCSPCVGELPSLDQLAKTFPQEDFAVITLCKDVKLLTQAKEAFSRYKITDLPLYFDTGEGESLFKFKGIPSSFILDRQGRLIGSLKGATEWDHWEIIDLIQAYISGNTPKAPSLTDRFFNFFTR